MEKQSNQFDLEAKLKNMSPKPLTPEEKTKAWSFIRQRIALERQKEFSGYRFPLFDIFARRKAVAFAAVVILLGSSLATAAAADSAKPGDFLFPLDLASERIRITLASDTKKDELRLKFAQERVNEAKIAVSIFVRAEGSGTATSSPPANPATSTPNTGTSTPGANINLNVKGVQQAKEALEVALERLGRTRAELEAKGNASAVRAIDSLIAELTRLAENHILSLEKFKASIEQNDDGLKIAIKASGDELKGKFKFEIEHKNNATSTPQDEEDDHDENSEERLEEKFEREEERLEERFDRLKERLEEQKDKLREREESLRERLRERFDRIFGRDDDEDDEDDDAPRISNISANASSTSAVVTWSTNEAADSRVWYSTATPLVIASTTPHASSTSLVTSHNVALSGLTASTTYYFLVTSADAAGNTSTSSESSFLTLP